MKDFSFFRGFFEDHIFAWWNIWVSIIWEGSGLRVKRQPTNMKHMYTRLGIAGVSKKFKGKLDQIGLWLVSTMLILGTLILHNLLITKINKLYGNSSEASII